TLDKEGMGDKERAAPSNESSYLNEVLSRNNRELQGKLLDSQRDLREAFDGALADLSRSIRGIGTTIPNSQGNHGEGSSLANHGEKEF
ncbi:hypothetical protein KI387_013945, partial [Taxus chinensis]